MGYQIRLPLVACSIFLLAYFLLPKTRCEEPRRSESKSSTKKEKSPSSKKETDDAKAEAKAEKEQERHEKAVDQLKKNAEEERKKEEKVEKKKLAEEKKQSSTETGNQDAGKKKDARHGTEEPPSSVRPLVAGGTEFPKSVGARMNVQKTVAQIRTDLLTQEKANERLRGQLRAYSERIAFLQARMESDEERIREFENAEKEQSPSTEDPLRAEIHAALAANNYAGAIKAFDTLKEKQVQRQIAMEPQSHLPPSALTSNVRQFESRDPASALDAETQMELLRAKPGRSVADEHRLQQLAEQIGRENQVAEEALRTDLAGGSDTASALQSALSAMPQGTVSVYVIRNHENLDFIVVRATEFNSFTRQISSREMDDEISQLLHAVRTPHMDPKPAAAKLYSALVAPIAGFLNEIQAKTILWSLDGTLRYVPLNALYDASKSQYLVEEYENVLVTPASVPYLLEAPQRSADWKGLAMGMSRATANTAPLPNVPYELRSVVHDATDADSHGPLNGVIRMDSGFTVEELESELTSQPQVVHLATHFILNPESGNSYLVFGSTGAMESPEQLGLRQMASDPRFNLKGTELLALSACDTASQARLGDGSEVDGLAIVAHRQHAKAVLATLWPVYDPSTAMLMADFYARWFGSPSMTKAEALRQAQLNLLYGGTTDGASSDTSDRGLITEEMQPETAGFRHPYYWAPFILLGNPE